MKLSSTYKTLNGDTFESIARKQFGNDSFALQLREANPGLAEPFVGGINVTIPENIAVQRPVFNVGQVDDQDQVGLLIDGQRFRNWESATLTSSIDGISTFSFTSPFEPDLTAFRDTFKPFSYLDVNVTVGDAQAFTGTMVSVRPDSSPERSFVTGSAYALPGVLNDCTAPASMYPIEWNDLRLREIATRLCRPFGIRVKFDAPQGAVFERVALSAGSKILPFLANLAKQRNLVIASDETGALVFQQSVSSGVTVVTLVESASPVTSVTPNFSEQQYYSSVTGLEPVLVGLGGSQYTARNPKLTGVVRPFTFSANDSEGGDTRQTVDAKIARMFGDMVSYDVTLNTWRTPGGDLWEPNTLVSLQAPRAMVYNPYTLLVRRVELSRNKDSQTALLNLVIPGAYNGTVPKVLPWEN